jgi:hypothetical protein
MPERPRRPDLDERFSLDEDTEPDDVLRKLLGADEEASDDPAADPEDA